MLLILGGLLVWTPVRADAQVFAITQVSNTNILVGTTITIPITITNTTGVGSQLFWSLTSNPSGSTAILNPTNTGPFDSTLFSWTPTQTGQVGFTVNASLYGTPYTTGMGFSVNVTNSVTPARPPVLGPILNYTINEGTPIQFYSYVTNSDNTTNFIYFSLGSGAPTNASFNTLGLVALLTNATTTNGVFQGSFNWTPGSRQVGLQPFTVIATETNTLLTASTNFTVNVALTNECEQNAEVEAAVLAGGTVHFTACTNLVLTNPLVVAATNVVLDAGTNTVTITGNEVQRLFTVLPGASLTLQSSMPQGLVLQGGSSDQGGAIYNMAGGTVVLSNCVLAGNSAVGSNGSNGADGNNDPNYGRDGGDASPGLPAVGGAVYNLGSLTAISCWFTNNLVMGGSGGTGGNGGSGSYRGGTSGTGGSGGLGFGGAIYNAGTRLWLSDSWFYGNRAVGGAGGSSGTAGSGAFVGRTSSGGAGAEGSGGALYSANDVTVLNCIFSGNTAQGGNSADGGEAGGGYGVNGSPGGSSFGGGACLLAGGQLISCDFSDETSSGGNAGNGGSGKYIAGNGGNGGTAVGGCLYNYGGATMVDCGFTNCVTIGGANGVAGGGPFAGSDGQAGSSSTNVSSTVTATNSIFASGLPGGISAAVAAVQNDLASDMTIASAAGSPGSPGSAPAQAAAAAGRNNTAAPAGQPAGLAGLPNASTGAGTNPAVAPRKPFTPLASAGGPDSATNAAIAPQAAKSSPLEAPLPKGMIDFRAADLSQVLDIYSMMVNRTVLRPATLPAPTITLTTQGQLTVGEGIQALEGVLALNGVTMVNIGDKFVKAIPEGQGNTAGAGFNTNGAARLPDLGQYVTHVAHLKYAKPSELVAVLQPFAKIPNGLLPIDSSQLLVLRDYAENVKRMLELIKEVDAAVPSEFVSEVIPIKYAQAPDIASALNSLSSGGGATTVGGSTSGGARSTRGGGFNRSGRMGGYPGQTTPGMMNSSAMQGATPTAARGSSFGQRLQNIMQRASQTGEIEILGQTKIIADERTNSLLVYATKEDMKTIKDIVAKLDVVLPQVLIEAAIISVTLNDSHDLGFSYLQHPQNSGRWTGVGAVNNNNMLTPGTFANGAVTNLGGGTLPQGFSYLMSWGQDLDATVTAAASDSRAKILQRPRIQTSHNEPAELFVGESRPYPTSSYYGGGAYGGYSSIQQLQIGVTLEVTPLINPDGLVVLDIHTKIDTFEGNVTIQNVGDVPVTSSKEASAKVSVRDHDTIILGGLIETDKNANASGVPLLMDIPLLGYLFRSSHADGARKELIVLIRPTVLPTPEIAALTATAEKNKMPGVRATEAEIRAEEMHRLKQAEKAEKKGAYETPVKP